MDILNYMTEEQKSNMTPEQIFELLELECTELDVHISNINKILYFCNNYCAIEENIKKIIDGINLKKSSVIKLAYVYPPNITDFKICQILN
jgi:hypothetical protein